MLFLENTGVRAPKVRDLPRVRQSVDGLKRGQIDETKQTAMMARSSLVNRKLRRSPCAARTIAPASTAHMRKN